MQVPTNSPGSAVTTGAQRWVAAVAVAIGIALRWYHVLVAHRPSDHVYSDMATYVGTAKRLFGDVPAQTIADTLYPPGNAYLLGLLHALDPSWVLACVVAFAMSVAVPLLCGLVAFDLFGERSALVAIALASLYWPFVDYAGYFLAEAPLTFCLALGMALLVRALGASSLRGRLALAFAGGLVLGAAATLKSVSLPAAAAVAALLVLAARRGGPRRLPSLFLTVALGVAVVLVPAGLRCTRLQDGRPCLLGNEVGVNVLLGHRPGLRGVRLYDERRETVMHFNCPTAMQKGYTGVLQVQHAAYESGELTRMAWNWIREHPVESLLLSIENVFDNFVGGVPWPSAETEYRRWALLSQQFYYLVILLPAALLLYTRRGEIRRLSSVGVAILLPTVPILGLMATTFVAKGEPRYRIPFDVFAIVLAAAFYASPGLRRDPFGRDASQ